MSCGERGIRTPGTLLRYTRFPGEPVQPLLHLSEKRRNLQKFYTLQRPQLISPHSDRVSMELTLSTGRPLPRSIIIFVTAASVVMSQAFNVPAFPVDTHIHRLMYRWGFSNGKNVVQTERDAKRIFPQEIWNKLHLQIIWYGREYSPARGWDLEKDIITKTIGRKSVINEYYKNKKSR